MSASTSWISINSNLRKGIELVNTLPQAKFNRLLAQIAASPQKDDQFLADELRKLSEELRLPPDALKLLVLSLAHVHKQASKVILKPTGLQDQLVDVLLLQAEKAAEFVRVWTEDVNRQFELGEARRLAGVSWELNVEALNDSRVKTADKRVGARVKLALEGKGGDEGLAMEFDREELGQLYALLENVQNKLDSI